LIGMILCGGQGKRLRPLTEEIPKPLIEIKENYTILDQQILSFKSAGIEKVVLLTGYLSEKIEGRYHDRWNGVRIEYSVEDEPLGTLNAIRMGIELVDEDVMIRNGDVVADINLKKMIQRFHESNYPATIFITRMRSPYGVVEISDDRIKRFHEKPLLNEYINGGIYCFTRSAAQLFHNFKITQNQRFRESSRSLTWNTGEIEKTVFPRLAESNQLGYYREDNMLWTSIDTTKDLEEIQKEYANRTDKPWGYEKILISTDKYLTKELFIYQGHSTSHHYHDEKDETMYILQGQGYIEFDERIEPFERNDTIRIEPKQLHSIVVTENTTIHEVSTPHPDDTIRIKDPYNRDRIYE